MECNRDEAIRAKEVAERKFKGRDLVGAKKFAMKAHALYPDLEGISQMLSTFDVYLAAENKVNGEPDWYAVLNISASADSETVKKQYRKLALSLHPDKNKSIGSDGAFKFLSEAWSVLSDKSRRLAYDQKRNLVVQNQKVSQPSRCNSSATNSNGFHNTAKTVASNMKSRKTAASTAQSPNPATLHPPKPTTFWTTCCCCKMQYEYMRFYLNRNLICPNCQQPFLAVETGIPANGVHKSPPWSSRQHSHKNIEKAKKTTYIPGRSAPSVPNMANASYPHGTSVDSYNHKCYQWGTHSSVAGVGNTAASSPAASQTMYVKNSSSKGVPNVLYASNSSASSSGKVINQEHVITMERTAKRRKGLNGYSGSNVEGNHVEQPAVRNGKTSIGSKGPITENETVNGANMVIDIRRMLIEKAQMDIRKKLNEWSLAGATKSAVKDKVEGSESDKSKLGKSVHHKKKAFEKKIMPGDSIAEQSKQASNLPIINVPDPDFHDFDKDRSEKAFDGNQVWAAYDDDDGMPRFYALIHKIISMRPFKMRFSWLNSKTNNELGPVNWVSSGFYKTCGEFRVGKYEITKNVNVFSHRVKWEKGLRGVIKIFPMKGEVWALYRNWSPDWNANTPEAEIHKYDMVEVLDDFIEEQGASITPLVKVAGFKNVFHRHMDPSQIRTIPKEEMFRFSHQVPSWVLTGEEAKNAPRGCTELDPAATPLELLKLITDIKDEAVEKIEQQQQLQVQQQQSVI